MTTELRSARGFTARRKVRYDTRLGLKDREVQNVSEVNQLTDPACGTCRKKCRKCDRARPICNRCRVQGFHCDGYPPKFQFCEIAAPIVVSPKDRNSRSRVNSSLSSRLSSEPVQVTQPEVSLPPTAIGDETQAVVTASRISPPATPASSNDDSASLTLLSPLSAHYEPRTPPLSDSPARSVTDEWLAHEPLLRYFDEELSESLAISIPGIENPFREYVLPLAYQHKGVLHALLGLSSCHMHLSGKYGSQMAVTASLEDRAAALHSLGNLLLKEEALGLTNAEEEYVLAIILLLVFHDVCETGISSHGAHLTGVFFLCTRMACPTNYSRRSKTSMFFLSALSWLDMLRGFSGAEKLAYSDEIHKCVRDHGSLSFHQLVGCHPAIFYRIGQVLQSGKAYLAGDLPLDQFQAILDDAERFLRGWDPDQAVYPTQHPEWKQLAEAYRHASLLRVLRFPDAFTTPCKDKRIKASVSAILDICAQMPRNSVFYKRLLFPLFMAGADTSSPHQIHYTSWCMDEIKAATGFRHLTMTMILTRVWKEREANPLGLANIPWMEFTCSSSLHSQHAYLLF